MNTEWWLIQDKFYNSSFRAYDSKILKLKWLDVLNMGNSSVKALVRVKNDIGWMNFNIWLLRNNIIFIWRHTGEKLSELISDELLKLTLEHPKIPFPELKWAFQRWFRNHRFIPVSVKTKFKYENIFHTVVLIITVIKLLRAIVNWFP